MTDKDALTAGKVVPGDVHPPKEWGGWVVIGPAGLAIVTAAAVDAVMGPAMGIGGSGGVVATHAATAAPRIDPNGEKLAGWLVVQNNGVALGTSKGALTDDGAASSDVRTGEAIESQAAVGGDRHGGDIDGGGIAASRIVVRHQNLVGIIRVRYSVCLGLGNIGKGLGVSNQVNVGSAIRQRSRQQIFG